VNTAYLTKLGKFLRFVAHRFDEDRCTQVAASLTFTTLLSLVPLVTIVLAVISAFPVFGDFILALKNFVLSNLVPGSAQKVITVYMQQFTEKASRLTLLGIVMIALTALMMMLTIDNAFNTIWRIKRRRKLFQRLLTYWAVLTIGPILIGGSLSLTSYLVSLSFHLVDQKSGVGFLVLKSMPILLTVFACALLYTMVPNRVVPFRHALVGGVVAGAAFEIMKKIFTVYITHVPTYTLVYGAFATIPIFLLWIYFSWLVVLAGAVITAALPQWEGAAWGSAKHPGKHFLEAMKLLEMLYDAHRSGNPVPLALFQKQTRMDWDEIENILDVLDQAGIARRISGGDWVLIRDAAQISVKDIYRLFIWPEELQGSGLGQSEAMRHAADCLAQPSGLDLTLEDVFRSEGTSP
jgi:membrane protein